MHSAFGNSSLGSSIGLGDKGVLSQCDRHGSFPRQQGTLISHYGPTVASGLWALKDGVTARFHNDGDHRNDIPAPQWHRARVPY